MAAYVPQHVASSALFQLATLLGNAARTMKIAAERLDRFIANRRKALADRRVLAEMSERELRDIGVCDARAYAWQNASARPAYERGEWRGLV